MCARRLVGVLAIALASCAQSPGGPLTRQADDPPSANDAFMRQVHLDVVAIVAGMTMAHGVQAVWLMPAR
jgi:hypothetical protein